VLVESGTGGLAVPDPVQGELAVFEPSNEAIDFRAETNPFWIVYVFLEIGTASLSARKVRRFGISVRSPLDHVNIWQVSFY
jgi:hypothetical protein